MKLLLAAVTFMATLGMLFLIGTGRPPKEDYARIVESLRERDAGVVVSVAPSLVKTRTFAQTPTLTPLISTLAPSPAPQNTPATSQISITLPVPTQTSSLTATLTPTPIPTPSPSVTPAPTSKQSEKININTANLAGLDKITGVGPVIAQRIIDYRNANGPFQKIEDIKNVKGIGDITFEKMKNEITI